MVLIWGMSLNPIKCYSSMCFYRSRNHTCFISNIKLNSVSSNKDQGIILTTNLNLGTNWVSLKKIFRKIMIHWAPLFRIQWPKIIKTPILCVAQTHFRIWFTYLVSVYSKIDIDLIELFVLYKLNTSVNYHNHNYSKYFFRSYIIYNVHRVLWQFTIRRKLRKCDDIQIPIV